MRQAISIVLLMPCAVHAEAESLSRCIATSTLDQYIEGGKKPLLVQENQKLEAASINQLESLLFVMVLDGYFPIPTRFALMAGKADHGPGLRLHSPTDFVDADPRKELLLGTILVGKYEDYLNSVRADEEKGRISKTAVFQSCQHRHLTIEFRSHPDFPKRLNVFIRNEHEYVSITDDNPYLWLNLIRIYFKLLERKT